MLKIIRVNMRAYYGDKMCCNNFKTFTSNNKQCFN